MIDITPIALVHYHEIGLKGHNRSNFEKRLQQNLQALLNDWPIARISRISGRILIEFKPAPKNTNGEEGVSAVDEAANIDIDATPTALHATDESYLRQIFDTCDFVTRVPGVARVSCGYRCDRDIDIMGQVAIRALKEAGDFYTFKVHARRAHTDFEIDSMQMNQLIGAALCATFPEKKVIMKDPDVTVGVEVIQGASYIYARSIRGIGGLPVGASGRVACLLSSGIDSPVATWRMARRGSKCIGVHFSGRPQTSDASEYLVDDIAQVLAKTGCISKVYMFGIGDYQREISLKCPPALRVILYRRLMFRVACAVASREKCGAIATGESLGQVASQTLENINCTNAVADRPVLRPLIGMDKLEIIDQAQELGTFEISTQDAPDCCTLFMPRSPETHGKLDAVEEAEALLPIDQWVAEILQNAEIKKY